MSKLYMPPTNPSDLLAFAESVANCRDANMHLYHSHIIQAARTVVKLNGGKLEERGDYMEGSDVLDPEDEEIEWEEEK